MGEDEGRRQGVQGARTSQLDVFKSERSCDRTIPTSTQRQARTKSVPRPRHCSRDSPALLGVYSSDWINTRVQGLKYHIQQRYLRRLQPTGLIEVLPDQLDA